MEPERVAQEARQLERRVIEEVGAARVQREHGSLRDDEQTTQLGQPGDHIMGQRIGKATGWHRRGGLALDEGHHDDRRPAGGSHDGGRRAAIRRH